MALEALTEQGQPSLRQLHDALLPFVVDEHNEPLPVEEASAELKRLTLNDLFGAMQSIVATVDGTAISPPTASA